MMSGGRLRVIQLALASHCPALSRSILIRSVLSFPRTNAKHLVASPFQACPYSGISSSYVYFAPLRMPAVGWDNFRGCRIRKAVIAIRMMGGGPRTFPGGVTKWQWKRMQEKKQKIREKAWLAREKLIYDRRRRAELMAAAPELEKPWERHSRSPTVLPSDFDPKIKAMADRFHKEGALDLWNDEDGPEQFSPPKSPTPEPHPLGIGLWRTKPEGENGKLSITENYSIIQDKKNANASKQDQRSKRGIPESGKRSSLGRQSAVTRRNIQSLHGRKQTGTARRTLQSLPFSEKTANQKQGYF